MTTTGGSIFDLTGEQLKDIVSGKKIDHGQPSLSWAGTLHQCLSSRKEPVVLLFDWNREAVLRIGELIQQKELGVQIPKELLATGQMEQTTFESVAVKLLNFLSRKSPDALTYFEIFGIGGDVHDTTSVCVNLVSAEMWDSFFSFLRHHNKFPKPIARVAMMKGTKGILEAPFRKNPRQLLFVPYIGGAAIG